MRSFSSFDELAGAVGEQLGPTDWLMITQEQVDRFAEATGDHQWIHVDLERAAAGPFAGTIAHGYLTLSLIPQLGQQLLSVDVPGARLNYGTNKVRFPSPLRVGRRVRASATIVSVTEVPAGRQLVTSYVVEIEDEPKPACVAETVALLLG